MTAIKKAGTPATTATEPETLPRFGPNDGHGSVAMHFSQRQWQLLERIAQRRGQTVYEVVINSLIFALEYQDYQWPVHDANQTTTPG